MDPKAARFEEGLVISMRINLAALGIPAIGLPLLLLLVFACVPKVRPDPISTGGGGAGGAGTMATSAGGSTTAVSASSSGTGGGSPLGDCTKGGPVFTILGDAELTGTPGLSDRLYLIPDTTGKHAMVHVVLEDNGMNRVLLRTVIDSQSPLGNFSQYGAVGTPSLRLNGAQVLADHLVLRGTFGNNLAEVAFAVDPDKGVSVDGALQYLPTPVECTQGGHPGKVSFAPGSAPPLYLFTCLPDDPAMPGTLFTGDGTTSNQLAVKDQVSPEMNPGLYAVENGVHLALFGGDKAATYFSYGSTAAALGGLQPLQLTQTSAALQGVFAMVPLAGDDGVTLISGFFDTTVGKGQFLAGPTLAKDYGALGKIPPGGLVPIQDIAMLSDVAPIFFPTWDPTGIFGGGASTDGATARIYWFTRDGQPRVFGKVMYTSPGPTILTANAAPLGTLNTLIVWTEQDNSASPPKYSVKGQKLICQVKS